MSGNVETNIRTMFGERVETVVDIGPRTIISPAAGFVEQTKVRAEVRACHGCAARDIAETEHGEEWGGPWPAQYPVLNHRCAVVVPGEMTTEERKMLHTALRSAKVIGDGVTEAGVGRAGGLGDLAVIPMIGCRTGTRSKKEHLAACYGHVADQIWAANTDRLLLIGGDAKNLWRNDLTVEQVEGRIGVMWDRYVVMVLPSPAGIMAMKDGRARREKIARMGAGLKVWREAMGARLTAGADDADDPQIRPVLSELARDCVKCGRAAQEIDRDGLGWCRADWDEGRRAWRRARGIIGTNGMEAML